MAIAIFSKLHHQPFIHGRILIYLSWLQYNLNSSNKSTENWCVPARMSRSISSMKKPRCHNMKIRISVIALVWVIGKTHGKCAILIVVRILGILAYLQKLCWMMIIVCILLYSMKAWYQNGYDWKYTRLLNLNTSSHKLPLNEADACSKAIPDRTYTRFAPFLQQILGQSLLKANLLISLPLLLPSFHKMLCTPWHLSSLTLCPNCPSSYMLSLSCCLSLSFSLFVSLLWAVQNQSLSSRFSQK